MYDPAKRHLKYLRAKKSSPEKLRESSRKSGYKRYHFNPEARKTMTESRKKWAKENAEKMKEYRRKWYEKFKSNPANKEKARNNAERWRKNNPEKFSHLARRNQHRRRLYKRLSNSKHTFEQWQAKLSYYGWKCVYCKIPLTFRTATKDHLIPLSKGGTDWASNIVPACLSCNCKKYNSKAGRVSLPPQESKC